MIVDCPDAPGEIVRDVLIRKQPPRSLTIHMGNQSQNPKPRGKKQDKFLLTLKKPDKLAIGFLQMSEN